MSRLNYDEWRQHLEETENLEALSMWQLKAHLQYFKDVRGTVDVMTDQTPNGKKNTCDERIKLLHAEIQHRRSRKPSWVAILSLLVGTAGLCLGIYNCSRPSPVASEPRPTPTATPQQSATGTPSPRDLARSCEASMLARRSPQFL